MFYDEGENTFYFFYFCNLWWWRLGNTYTMVRNFTWEKDSSCLHDIWYLNKNVNYYHLCAPNHHIDKLTLLTSVISVLLWWLTSQTYLRIQFAMCRYWQHFLQPFWAIFWLYLIILCTCWTLTDDFIMMIKFSLSQFI